MPESLKERLQTHEVLLSQRFNELNQLERVRSELMNEILGLKGKVSLLKQLVKDLEKPEESKKPEVENSKSKKKE